MASAVIFGGGALLTFAAMVWLHDAVEVQAYWNAGGMGHVFWYAAAAALGCVGYGSVFLAVGLYIRNPIIPAAVLLAWEGVNGILPHALQRMSILYYSAPSQSSAPPPSRQMAHSIKKGVPMMTVPDVARALDWYASIGFTEIARYEDDGLVNLASSPLERPKSC